MKENPAFIQSILRNMLASYLISGRPILASFTKIERMLMRYASCHNRVIRPAEAAIELDLHKQTVIKYAESW